MTKLSAKLHKWLALLLAVPILFWFVSGLFFAIAPIEKVRSEHMSAEIAPIPIPIDQAAAGLGRIAASGAMAGEKIELRTLMSRPVALISSGEDVHAGSEAVNTGRRPELTDTFHYDARDSQDVVPSPRVPAAVMNN